MREPLVETVLMLLLVIFFGVQQRRRPQLYFRIWTLGWLLFCLSLIGWDWDLTHTSVLVQLVQECLRYDLLLLSGASFVSSLLDAEATLRETLKRLARVALPALLLLDLHIVLLTLRPHLLWPTLLVVVSQAGGVLWLLRAPWKRHRRMQIIAAVAVVCTVGMVRELVEGSLGSITELVSTELFLSAAVLFASECDGRAADILGTTGFALWGLSYGLIDFLRPVPWALHASYLFWNIPRYVVGFSMVLRVLAVDSEEKAALVEQLQVLYSDFKELYESHPQPLWIYEPAQGQILAVNRAAVECYGYSEDHFLSLRMRDLEAPWDAEFDEVERQAPLKQGVRARHRFKTGVVRWMNTIDRGISFQGQPARLLHALDITDRLKDDRQLLFKAHHDSLTGLPNRVQLSERLHDALALCGREGTRLALLAIDVDHFKKINDTYGHSAGDACLKEVATRLQRRIRQMDTIARTGGEEFIAVVGRLNAADDARKVAETLLRQFAEPVRQDGLELYLTISIGVAIFPDDGTLAADLHQRADAALYAAKRAGRDCVVMAGAMAAGSVGR